MVRATRISRAENMVFNEKLSRFSWPLFAMMCLVLLLSIISLYSAGTPTCGQESTSCEGFGGWRPYALSQMGKMGLGFGLFFIAAFMNIKTWLKNSYLVFKKKIQKFFFVLIL